MDSSGTFIWVKEIPHSSGPSGDATVGQSKNISLDNSNNIYINFAKTWSLERDVMNFLKRNLKKGSSIMSYNFV